MQEVSLLLRRTVRFVVRVLLSSFQAASPGAMVGSGVAARVRSVAGGGISRRARALGQGVSEKKIDLFLLGDPGRAAGCFW